MYASRQPLDDYTKEALLLIMDGETTTIGAPEPCYGQEMSVMLEMQKDALQSLTARDERVLERATSYLDASQYEILDDNLEVRREQIRMSTRYLESQLQQQAQSEQAATQD